jgi:hypothetical protein
MLSLLILGGMLRVAVNFEPFAECFAAQNSVMKSKKPSFYALKIDGVRHWVY